jgi:uncharacterized protein (TIGR02145 family)
MQKSVFIGKGKYSQRLYRKIVLCGMLLLFAACDPGGTGEDDEDGTPLSIASVTQSGSSSGVSTRSTTYTGNIGIFRLAGDNYVGSVSNAKYSYNTTTGKWEAASDIIYLTKNTATLCAYCPYSSTTEYANGTAVTLTSQEYAAAKDLCYETDVSASSTQSATFALNHAYAKITFTLTRSSTYPANGACAVSNISIANTGIVNTGSLNMTTGAYTQSSTGTAVSYAPTANSATPTTLATTGIASGGSATTSVLMAPVTTAMSGNLTLTFTVDGKTMSTTLSLATYTGLTTLAANTNYSIAITINGTALSVGTVTINTGWTNVSSGTINTVTMAKEANCYMVPLGEAVYIPVSRAQAGQIAAGNSSFTLSSISWTADLLWTTSSYGVSASGSVADITYNRDGGYIKVTAGAEEGNSVIAIYDASNNVLWSWHIWTTNYDPNTPSNGANYTLANTVTSNVFMDRNLGAASTAYSADNNILHYQWGRKDPFPAAGVYDASGASASVDITSYTAAQALAVSVQHPFAFIRSSDDWNTSPNTALWGGADITSTTPAAKTIFDPCPAGWRVPVWSSSKSPWEYLACSSGTFTYLSSGYSGTFTNGWAFTYNSAGIGFYPAAGYRYSSGGTFNGVGSFGKYWSASPFSSYGYSLIFSSGDVLPLNNNDRAYGFSVRCVKE